MQKGDSIPVGTMRLEDAHGSSRRDTNQDGDFQFWCGVGNISLSEAGSERHLLKFDSTRGRRRHSREQSSGSVHAEPVEVKLNLARMETTTESHAPTGEMEQRVKGHLSIFVFEARSLHGSLSLLRA